MDIFVSRRKFWVNCLGFQQSLTEFVENTLRKKKNCDLFFGSKLNKLGFEVNMEKLFWEEKCQIILLYKTRKKDILKEQLKWNRFEKIFFGI